jgi:hypothetical protein
MLNIPIPDQFQSFVEQQATDAGFPNVSGYVLHLIQQEQQRVSDVDQPLNHSVDRKTDPILLMQLPLADRRQVLATQAAVMATHYEQDNAWRDLMAGEFIEYLN